LSDINSHAHFLVRFSDTFPSNSNSAHQLRKAKFGGYNPIDNKTGEATLAAALLFSLSKAAVFLL
jgi:hypothetical protein